jgi:hypothetical protein
MSEVENSNVVEEVVQPSNEEQVQQQAQSEPEEGSKEYNFREMRRAMQEQQRELYELRNYVAYQSQAPQQKQEEDVRFDKDDIPTWGQLEKVIDKKAEAKARELMQQQQADELEDRVRVRIKDYDDVVTEENVKTLFEDPILTEAIKHAPDPYSAAYKMIKGSHFYNQKIVPPKKNLDAEKIVKNAQKPMSSNAVRSEAIQNATSYASYSEDEKQSAWRRMNEASKRR